MGLTEHHLESKLNKVASIISDSFSEPWQQKINAKHVRLPKRTEHVGVLKYEMSVLHTAGLQECNNVQLV